MKNIVKGICLLLLIALVPIDICAESASVVVFKKNDACSLNTPYHSVLNNSEEKVNGCYASDAAYLNTIGRDVYFKIGGDIGFTDIDNVDILDASQYSEKLSIYETKNGHLFHNIKNSIESPYYAFSIDLGDMPHELTNNTKYYSYDGNYFYTDFDLMINDYKSDSYSNAINKTKYENFYEYMNIFETSRYDANDLEKYIYEILGINGYLNSYRDLNHDGANDYVNLSQLYNNVLPFIKAQNEYGINASILLSIALVESSFGKTLSAYEKNNLFNVAALVSDYEKKELGFEKIEDSINSYAKYQLINIFLNEEADEYHGAYLGNKGYGINASYSKDPYWGEKVASAYYKLDKELGYKEKGSKVETANENNAFEEEVISIELAQDFIKEVALNEPLDLRNQFIKVKYNSKEELVALNSEMVKNYEKDIEGTQTLTISYLGKSIETKINVSRELAELKDELVKRIDECVRVYKKYQTYDDKELKFISQNINKVNIDLTFEEIRYLDLIYLENNDNLSYLIDENDLDLSISGLGLALNKNKDKLFYQFYDNTYHVNVNNVSNSNKNKIEAFVSNYGFKCVEFFNLSYRYNLKEVELDTPIIVQIKLDNKEDNTNYVVYLHDENENYIKCKTTYSQNYLQFMTPSKGDFVILKRDGFNTVDLEDGFENLSYLDNKQDSFKIMLEIMWFVIMILYCVVSYIIYYQIFKNREKRWNAYRRSLQRVATVQEGKQKN